MVDFRFVVDLSNCSLLYNKFTTNRTKWSLSLAQVSSASADEIALTTFCGKQSITSRRHTGYRSSIRSKKSGDLKFQANEDLHSPSLVD